MKKTHIIIAAAVVAVVAVAALIAFGIFETPPYSDYQDGVYIGEARGYRKHLKTQVTLDGGYITEVDVIEHYESGKEYYAAPIAQIPAAIIQAQSVDVDIVSGATLTSVGITDAVRNALDQAK